MAADTRRTIQTAPQTAADLVGFEVVLPATRSILLLCHAPQGHLHMSVVGVVLQPISKGQA